MAPVLLLGIILLLIGAVVWRDHRLLNRQDPSKGQPVLTEQARVFHKEIVPNRLGSWNNAHYVQFYIYDRDCVVECKVPAQEYASLELRTKGDLTHQGGTFLSFMPTPQG